LENKIGIIGIGRMGQIIMKAFCDHCYKVYASDPSPHSQEIIKQQGAILMDSPKAVGEKAEVIVLSLPAPKHVNEVILGNSGLNKIIGKKHIIVDTSTVDPQTSKNAFAQCKKTGASYLDAPILGRPDSFGKWVLPVGGDEKVLEEVKAVLTTFAHKVIYAGGPGSGHALKLLNQLMFSAINGITAEMFALVDKINL